MDQPGPPAVLTFTLALAAGLAVAVCLTVGFASSGEAVTPQETVGQDPPYLLPDPETVTREEYTRPGIDVSAAAAADAQNVRGRHRAAVFSERLDGAEDPAALVAAVTDELGARAEALDQQHAQLLARYSDGEISTGRLLRELVRQRAAAAGHRRLADRVEAAVIGSDSINGSRAVREQSEALDDEILALESPVTDALADGQVDPWTTVYAQAGTDTLVLALTNRTQMQRQATLRDQREKNAPNQFVQEAGENENANALAINRAEELYGGDDGAELSFSLPPFDATVYGVEGSTIGGSFVGYLDGATTNIFHEQQTVSMSDVPVSGRLTNTSGNLELTVETTITTGPMRVSVTSGGDPVEGAELLVANQSVGTTDARGQTWVTQPLAGATVRVTVEEEPVTVTLP
jgi:hypothetical protein